MFLFCFAHLVLLSGLDTLCCRHAGRTIVGTFIRGLVYDFLVERGGGPLVNLQQFSFRLFRKRCWQQAKQTPIVQGRFANIPPALSERAFHPCPCRYADEQEKCEQAPTHLVQRPRREQFYPLTTAEANRLVAGLRLFEQSRLLSGQQENGPKKNHLPEPKIFLKKQVQAGGIQFFFYFGCSFVCIGKAGCLTAFFLCMITLH